MQFGDWSSDVCSSDLAPVSGGDLGAKNGTPNMIVSVPFFAPKSPPDTGASNASAPFSDRKSVV